MIALKHRHCADWPVLITGSTGFLGQHLVEKLQMHGAKVRVLVRSSNGVSNDHIIGDLRDATSLQRACAGIDTVFHAAGFAHADAIEDAADQHWAINAAGTFHLIAAAVAAHVQRFVFISSVKAVGPTGSQCVNEDWPVLPDTPYGLAKRAAEDRLLSVAQTTGMHAVVLRPALMYGPDMKGNLPKMIAAVRRGLFPPLPETGNQRSLVHVEDVVQAALLAAMQPIAAGQRYFVTDGTGYSGRALYVLMRQAAGLSVPQWSVPAVLLKRCATFEKILGWAAYDNGRICETLGYQPTHTFSGC